MIPTVFLMFFFFLMLLLCLIIPFELKAAAERRAKSLRDSENLKMCAELLKTIELAKRPAAGGRLS
jgi:hypothetical protein